MLRINVDPLALIRCDDPDELQALAKVIETVGATRRRESADAERRAKHGS